MSMKRWFLRWNCLLLALYFCVASVCAGEAEAPPSPETRLSPECRESLDAALARLREADVLNEEEAFDPEGVMLLSEAVIAARRLMGSPEVETRLPLNPDLPYYPALCWIYSQGWWGELGLEELDKAGMQKLKRDPQAAEAFCKRFEERTIRNAELVILLYKLECHRGGQKPPEIPETFPKEIPYKDVNWKAPQNSKEADYLTPLRWAAYHNLVSGILDEAFEDAIYFHPIQEEIGKGTCLRGQFYAVLYRYELMIHPPETAPAAQASAETAPAA